PQTSDAPGARRVARLCSRSNPVLVFIDLQSIALQKYPGWYSDRGGTVRNICKYDCVGAYSYVVPDSDASKNLRSRPDPNIIPYDWSRLLIPPDSNRDFLIDPDVFANHASVVENSTEPVMAEVNILSANSGFVRDETTEPKS
ncbi:MAG: hypothetical protein WBQ94_29990, partial [Terracidiphilus sp.]